jgi:hypothetical protein
MQTLKNLSRLMAQYTRARNFFASLVLFILITGVMEVCPFGSVHLRSINNGVGMLDMLSGGYSPALVYNMFEQIGAAGRVGYAQLLGLDVLFALIYMCLLSLALTALLRWSGVKNAGLGLNLLPVLRSGLDLLENALLLTLLFSYPARLDPLVTLASSVTVVKWVVYIIILVLIAALSLYGSIKAILARIQSRVRPAA